MWFIRIMMARLKGRLLRVGLAGAAKWGATLALVAYLKAHGQRPIWGILIGLAVGAAILVSAFWPVTPPSQPPAPPMG